jgi:pullulanase
MNAHILDLKRTAFILWRPFNTNPAPKLIIGQFQPGNPPRLADQKEHQLKPLPGHPDVFAIDAAVCGLTDNTVRSIYRGL